MMAGRAAEQKADFFNRNEREAPSDELLWVELDKGRVFKAERPSNSRNWYVYCVDGYVMTVPGRAIIGWRRGPTRSRWG